MAEGLPLSALQGEWVASRGEVIEIDGTSLSINGMAMPRGLKLSPDGQRVVGFSIYTAVEDAQREGEIVWNAGHQEIIWRRPSQGEVQARMEKMEATINDKAATCGGQAFNVASEQDAVRQLNELIKRWREGPTLRVRSCDVCPDWTNRAETGLSVDHVHYIATLISNTGFKSRRRGLNTRDGAHDVPILVRETASSELGSGALAKWQEATAATQGFPPFFLAGKKEFFCSLGNGHFSQALNLFRASSPNLWTGRPYSVGTDSALREALDEGVESVILSADMPVSDRRFVSEMLNRSHGRQWHVDESGHVSLEDKGPADLASQFVALSKVLDAEELGCLKVGVDVDGNPVDRAAALEDGRPSEMSVAACAAAGDNEEEAGRGMAPPKSRL